MSSITHLIVPVDHDRRGGEDGAVGEGPDLGEAALVRKYPVELGDPLLVDSVLQVLVRLERQELRYDDGLATDHHERLALVVASAVLEEEVDHAQVPIPARLDEAGGALKHATSFRVVCLG